MFEEDKRTEGVDDCGGWVCMDGRALQTGEGEIDGEEGSVEGCECIGFMYS